MSSMEIASSVKKRKRRPILMRALKVGVPVLASLVAALYLGVSYMIASGVVKSNRKLLYMDSSSDGLKIEVMEFSTRGGAQRLSGWSCQAGMAT